MKEYPYRYVARVTIQFTTPFIIGGGNDFFADATFVADANGLPALPGSSIAGVLRHQFAKNVSEKAADNLFGCLGNGSSHGSRCSISWGCIHDSNNKPVEGVVDTERLTDPVLRLARHAVVRDHVCIDHRGAASNKFDERVVNAGHRFSFELALTAQGNEEDKASWDELLHLLGSPDLRLGGKSRRGLGAFETISLWQKAYDLRNPQQRDEYLDLPRTMAHQPCPLDGPSPESRPRDGAIVTAQLQIIPDGFWIFGGGVGSRADMNPVREETVLWDQHGGRVTENESRLVIPGSSVKGALAHRTAFHYNRLTGMFADNCPTEALQAQTGTQNHAVQSLFGFSKDDRNEVAGQRGRVLINDQFYLNEDTTAKPVNHVAIDRFTAGTIQGALYSEEPLYRGAGINLSIVITAADQIDQPSRAAFAAALDDLVEGRLALGAGAGRGNGYFTGAVGWSDNGAWVRGEI